MDYRPTVISGSDPGMEGMTDSRTVLAYKTSVNPAITATAFDIFLGPQEPATLESSLLQEWITHFMKKQQDYGDAADDLGAPGQYAEIHRKLGKLRRAMWEGKPLVGEPVEEVLLDLIGHCFLSIRHIRKNNYGGKVME